MKSCGNCVNCEKVKPKNGKEFWACEEYGIVNYGVPANVTPPSDDACEFWTDDPSMKWKRVHEISKYL